MRFIYISPTNSLDHWIQGTTEDGGDTPLSLGRCSVIDKVDTSSVLMVSAELLSDRWGEGVLVLKVAHEVGELSPFHVVAAPVKAVMGGGEGIQNAVELSHELVSLLIKSLVLIHLGNSCWVVELPNLLDEGMIAPISAGEEGKEPQSCGLCGGLSIVRIEEEFDNIGGLPRLLPCHEFHCPIPDGPDSFWDHHLASICWDSSGDSSLIMFKAIGNAE